MPPASRGPPKTRRVPPVRAPCAASRRACSGAQLCHACSQCAPALRAVVKNPLRRILPFCSNVSGMPFASNLMASPRAMLELGLFKLEVNRATCFASVCMSCDGGPLGVWFPPYPEPYIVCRAVHSGAEAGAVRGQAAAAGHGARAWAPAGSGSA